jgi:hypothetical protein
MTVTAAAQTNDAVFTVRPSARVKPADSAQPQEQATPGEWPYLGMSMGKMRGGEGLFEDGLEKLGGVGAGVLDFRFQGPTNRHQRLHTLHDGGLLFKGWEWDQDVC